MNLENLKLIGDVLGPGFQIIIDVSPHNEVTVQVSKLFKGLKYKSQFSTRGHALDDLPSTKFVDVIKMLKEQVMQEIADSIKK